jgi:hypothetical protein
MFYDSFQATVPGADVTAEGIEYLVEVEGEWWKKWTTPPNGEGSPFKVVPDMTPPGQVVGLKAEISGPYEVKLSWAEASDNVGVSCYEVYRGTFKGFAPVQERLIASTYKTTCYDIEVKAGQPYWYAVRAKDRAGSPGRPSVAALARIPTYPPPSPPAGVEATPGPGKIKISWNELALPVVGYNIYRAEAGASDKTLLNTRGLVRQSVYIDAGLKDKTNYTYTVRAVDRGGQESVASKPAAAMPLPRRESPVFAAHFENSPDAESGLKGNIEGSASYSAGVVGQALDLRSGGWLAFEHNDIFDISGELTLEAWVNFDSIDGMPVFLSHGQWRERGFFVQVLGGRIRFSLGGLNDLDAGRIEPGRWYHVVCTYDMKDMRVYINGREAGRRGAPDVDLNPWVGRLYIGRYTLSARPYEVSGLIDEVKIYQRSRTAQEIKNEYDSIASRLPR